uniref:DUF7286 family protein n=1 Tax=Cryptosporangium minutisporangium TaxID=113569 RepID=UPI00366D0E85
LERIGDVADTHADVQEGLEDELSDEIDATDNALADMTEFAQDALVGDVTEREGTLEGSPLLEDVTFTPAGSPTYLSLEVVDREEVPAAGDTEHAPLAAKNDNWFAVPYTEVAGDLLSRVLNALEDDEEVAITLRTAGEMLQSAELVDKIDEQETLGLERDYLKEEIENEINDLVRDTADEISDVDHLDIDE